MWIFNVNCSLKMLDGNSKMYINVNKKHVTIFFYPIRRLRWKHLLNKFIGVHQKKLRLWLNRSCDWISSFPKICFYSFEHMGWKHCFICKCFVLYSSFAQKLISQLWMETANEDIRVITLYCNGGIPMPRLGSVHGFGASIQLGSVLFAPGVGFMAWHQQC